MSPTASPAPVRSCPGCGSQAGSAIEAWALRDELATSWLLMEDGVVVARSFCRGCAPVGPVADVACVSCGDGPLLAGAPAEQQACAAVDTWLAGTDGRSTSR